MGNLKHVQTTIPPETHRKFVVACAKKDIKMTDVLRNAIVHFLENEGELA